MGKRIDAQTRAEMVKMYLSDDSMTFKAVAEKFHVAALTARNIINEELNAGNGVKPDRRPDPPETPWMEHITPLHRHKQELENAIERKQAELDAVRQEYRDFLATLEQLMKEEV